VGHGSRVKGHVGDGSWVSCLVGHGSRVKGHVGDGSWVSCSMGHGSRVKGHVGDGSWVSCSVGQQVTGQGSRWRCVRVTEGSRWSWVGCFMGHWVMGHWASAVFKHKLKTYLFKMAFNVQ